MIPDKSKLHSDIFSSSFNEVKKCEENDVIKRSNSVVTFLNPNYFKYLAKRLIGRKISKEGQYNKSTKCLDEFV